MDYIRRNVDSLTSKNTKMVSNVHSIGDHSSQIKIEGNSVEMVDFYCEQKIHYQPILGYFDAAHFVRDFLELSELSPTLYRKKQVRFLQ